MTLERLVDLTADAARSAIRDLFDQHRDEDFYYVSLICSGPAPFLSAWSKQALDHLANGDKTASSSLKWSYADSPYCGFRLDLFEPLCPHFESLATQTEGDVITLSLQVSEAVMARLDAEGLFGRGLDRDKIFVGAEVMPPDWTNTERARRLNPPGALATWLVEAAETKP